MQTTNKTEVILAIDPGTEISGVVVLENDQIIYAANAKNTEIVEHLRKYKQVGVKVRAVIESIKPYYGHIRPETIETCEWIGELKYRLRTARIVVKTLSRSEVRKWVFETFNDVCVPLIKEKNKKKGKVRKDGSEWTPSFHSVDDGIVRKAMRSHLKLETKNFQSNKLGLSSHSWQALALGMAFKSLHSSNNQI